MLDYALANKRIIGMIQPKERVLKDSEIKNPKLYEVGCAGRVTAFSETNDSRYELILKGVCRFRIIKEKKIQIDKSEAERFYKVHETKPFYDELCTYLSSGPIIVMKLERENAILANRKLMGSTNPKDAEEGTIRKKFGLSIDKNSVHGSDSLENANIELDFFFKI